MHTRLMFQCIFNRISTCFPNVLENPPLTILKFSSKNSTPLHLLTREHLHARLVLHFLHHLHIHLPPFLREPFREHGR